MRNIYHMTPSFHLRTNICSQNDVPPHDFNLRTRLCIPLLTYETMPENIGFTDSKAVRHVHCKKTYLYATWTCACANFDTTPCMCAVSNIISPRFA